MFESVDVSVELPERIRSGPSCDLMRRMPSTMSGPRPSNGPHSRLSGRWVAINFLAAFRRSAIGLLGAFGQKPDPGIVGATAKQQLSHLSLSATTTEPIPDRKPGNLNRSQRTRSGSTGYEDLDRSFSEPLAERGAAASASPLTSDARPSARRGRSECIPYTAAMRSCEMGD
jgi:hypothetical protein